MAQDSDSLNGQDDVAGVDLGETVAMPVTGAADDDAEMSPEQQDTASDYPLLDEPEAEGVELGSETEYYAEGEGEEGLTQELAAGSFARHNVISKPKGRGKKIAVILCSVIGGLVVAAYIAGCVYFYSHFGFNTTINDVDCSYKTVEEVTSLVKGQVEDYQLAIVEREDKTESILGSDISLEYVEDGQIQQLLTDQRFYAWPLALFQGREESDMHASVSFDESALTEKINALECMQDGNMSAPQDAYPEFDGSAWVIHPEYLGTTLDKTVTAEAIQGAVTGTLNELNLSDAGCYVAPGVTTQSEDLISQVSTYNDTIPFSITYIFGEESETIPAETMYSWVVFNEDGTWYLDEEAVRSWLSDFGSRHDTVGTERTFTGADGEEYTVSGGTYGWEVDESAEYDAIVADFENKSSESREPYYVQTAESFDEADWGDSYIDLNLTKQHVWVVIDGEVAMEADVVTGLPIPSRETSSGVWYVLEKQRNKTLTGDLTAAGVPEYQTPVSYWVRMTWTGMGFHDATWQSSFGGDRYTYAGSHGCINMAYSDAATLYDLVWEGMPIVSHY